MAVLSKQALIKLAWHIAMLIQNEQGSSPNIIVETKVCMTVLSKQTLGSVHIALIQKEQGSSPNIVT